MLGSSRRARARVRASLGTLVALWALAPLAHGASLPDGRAYELVSPSDKLGSDVLAESTRTHASAGETPPLPAAVTFASLGGFADVHGTGVANEYLAQRTATPNTNGWSTHAITPPQEPLTFPAVALSLEPLYDGVMAADLTKGVFRSWSPLTSAPNVAEVPNLYLRDDLRNPGAGLYRLLTDSPILLNMPDPNVELPILPFAVDATDAFDHMLFESDWPLTPDARGRYPKLYKRDGMITRLVTSGSACSGGTPSLGPGQCSAAGLGARPLRYTPRVLSDDGRRVLFTAPVTSFGVAGGVDPRPGVASKLFQLDDRGTTSTDDDAIVQVNTSERSVPESGQAASYQIASLDGSRVFFISSEQLTDDVGSGLYLWERQPTDETQSVVVDATGGSLRLTFHSHLSTGSGEVQNGSDVVTGLSGSFAVGQTITAPGISARTTVTEIDSSGSSLTLSRPATATATETLHASLDVTTPALPYGATAAQVQGAVEALAGIGAGNVTVTEGPDSAYLVTFTGALAGVNVAPLTVDTSALTGGAMTATVTTPRPVHNVTLIVALAGANFDGAISASEDGRRLYFGAAGDLVRGAPPMNRGLYYWQDADGTPGGTLSLIGAVHPNDLQTIVNFTPPQTVPRLARVTPDGRYLAFVVSDGSGLAPRYDHSGCFGTDNANRNPGVGCSEVYIYRADSSSPTLPDVVCASCRTSAAITPASTWISIRRGTSVTPGTTYLNRALSDDGRRVFFSTAKGLVSGDTNKKFDAYEYDILSGTQHLLSSGKDPSDSYFLDASADGDNVFVLTRERLVGWDTDNAFDLYDARVGGGFPEPVLAASECVGDACQGAGPGVLGEAPLGSEVFRGPGNASESVRQRGSKRVRCARGKVKRRVRGRTRCVRRGRGGRRGGRGGGRSLGVRGAK